MNNYYEFNYNEDRESFEYFNSLPINVLNTYLNDNFNYIEFHLKEFANVFKKCLMVMIMMSFITFVSL